MKQLWIDVGPDDTVQGGDRIYSLEGWQTVADDLVGRPVSACWRPVQRAVEQPAQQAEGKFAAYNEIASQYGYEVSPDGFVGLKGKAGKVKMVVKGIRLRMESESGNLLASYPAKPESLEKFLKEFWFAEKKPQEGQAQPAQQEPVACKSAIEKVLMAAAPLLYQSGHKAESEACNAALLILMAEQPAQQELQHDEHAPQCSAEDDLVRGILASELRCWNRLTEDEANNLVAFVRSMPSKQTAQQEPVLWLYHDSNSLDDALNEWAGLFGSVLVSLDRQKAYRNETPLYTALPQRQPLTRKQLAECWMAVAHIEHATDRQTAFARQVEARHGIKGDKP